MYETGVVYLVGAGGEDPGLIASRGKEVLARADVVVYEASLSGDLLELCPSGCDRVEVTPQGQRKGLPAGMRSLLVDHAEEGKTIVRLYPGDPLNFGLCVEEAKVLTREGIPFEVIPGLSATLAAPTFAGIPLCVGEGPGGFSVVEYPLPAGKSLRESAYCALAIEGSTLVFSLRAESAASLAADMISGGVSGTTSVAIISQGGSPAQRVLETRLDSVSSVKERGEDQGGLVVIVGEVNRFRWELNWFEGRPLHGRRILITRPREQADEFARLLEEVGAEPLIAPTIRITPPDDWGPLDAAIERLGTFDWVIFTSVNGVRFFSERLSASGRDARAFGPDSRVLAIGPATARVLEDILRVRADAVPEKYVAEGILEMLSGEELSGKRILIPRAKEAREILPEELAGRGAKVDLVSAYQTLPAEPADVERLRSDLREGRVEMVTFTSSSTVRNFVELLGEDFLKEVMEKVIIASIGPITSATAREMGLNLHVEAEISTTRGLARAIVDFYRFSPAVDWRDPAPWVGDH